MNLGQANAYFSNTPVRLFDGEAWHSGYEGAVESLDRNIAREGVGVTRRIFRTTEKLDERWQAVEIAEGRVFLLASYGCDVGPDGVYNHIYQINEATKNVEVLAFESDRRASGSMGPSREVVVATAYANFLRSTSFESSTVDEITFTQFDVEMSAAKERVVNGDTYLRVDGYRYKVNEFFIAGQLLKLIVTRN